MAWNCVINRDRDLLKEHKLGDRIETLADGMSYTRYGFRGVVFFVGSVSANPWFSRLAFIDAGREGR